MHSKSGRAPYWNCHVSPRIRGKGGSNPFYYSARVSADLSYVRMKRAIVQQPGRGGDGLLPPDGRVPLQRVDCGRRPLRGPLEHLASPVSETADRARD